MDEKVKEHLTNALEAYETQLGSVKQFVENMKPQLEGAMEHEVKLTACVTECKELLGITDEDSSEEETEIAEPASTKEETVSS